MDRVSLEENRGEVDCALENLLEMRMESQCDPSPLHWRRLSGAVCPAHAHAGPGFRVPGAVGVVGALSVLYQLIEKAKEILTESNIPHGHCVICLYGFQEGEVFTKTSCYHYFHSHCLGRYVSTFGGEELQEAVKGSWRIKTRAEDSHEQGAGSGWFKETGSETEDSGFWKRKGGHRNEAGRIASSFTLTMPPLTPQTPPPPTRQTLTPPNRRLILSLLRAPVRILVLLVRRTRCAHPIAELLTLLTPHALMLLTLLTAGDSRWSLEEAGETEEKEEVDEEDMWLMRFLRLCWRTWPSSACLQQKAAGTAERLRTPANTETDI
ncbi:hypothetical protein PHYPO_G00040010 [Pangasianodon hypophthalmus]|uniref:RING-type domain-containing protein n=1 Tax=Pangasianodon hypophthalmus TaxID=310915 RepID=A0A5N5MEV1_PANHP|nr:hypothetical protein PHYPO_G00040010 [Pangasianodon hypophthalmus]